MRFNSKPLEKAFRTAIAESFGPLEATEEDPRGNQLIDCSPRRFSDALFVVKRNHYEAGLCQAHVMNTDEFDVRWNVFFADFDNHPFRHDKAPRQQVKYASQILVESMYGSEVADGMDPKSFDSWMAVCFMNCIAEASDSIEWTRDLLKETLDRALEIYPAIDMQAKLKVELVDKAGRQTVKI